MINLRGFDYFDDSSILDCITDVIRDSAVLQNQGAMQCFYRIKNYSRELYNHSFHVALLSVILGMHQYLHKNDLINLFTAGLFHDYGKVYIARSLLEKPVVLSREERQTLELHSIVGYFYLKQETDFNESILNGVLDHHEKADGSGYSLGKKSEEISLYGKIISIADVYDAMVSDRVYRKSLPKEDVLDYMKKCENSHFDVGLTECFISIAKYLDFERLNRSLKDVSLNKYQIV